MYKLIYLLLIVIFIFTINIFYKITSNTNNLIGINIVILLNLIISIICTITSKIIFDKNDLKNNFKKNIKNAVSNSFFITSSISIIIAIIIYSFLKDILNIFNLKTGLINYIDFASKIWFISSPFIGLEITIFRYFDEIEFYKKNSSIHLCKLIVFVMFSFILYFKYPSNCLVYAKPLCDVVFLIYYTKICFELTFKKI